MTNGVDGALARIAATEQPLAGNKAVVDERKTLQAAEQFEALLIAQMLRTIRESGGGWLGTGEDAAAESATGMAEEQFAQALTAQGGLGLARIALKGLQTPTVVVPPVQKE